jgi:pyruvate kinase
MADAPRRTKILATIGPASESEAVLREMIDAGMDAVRLNLSHGTLEEALATHARVRALAEELGRPVGTLVDLPGPKVRAGSFGREGVELPEGHRLRLVQGATTSRPATASRSATAASTSRSSG